MTADPADDVEAERRGVRPLVARTWSRVRHSPVARMALGAGLGQGTVVLATPVLTRLYRPEDFAILSVFVSVVSIAGAAATGRYEGAIPIPTSTRRVSDVVATACVALLATVVLGYAALAAFHDTLVAWLQVPGIGPYLLLTPIGAGGLGLYRVLTMWAAQRQDYGAIARTRLTRGLAESMSAVALGIVLAGSAVGLVVGAMLGRLAGSGGLLLAWRQENRRSGWRFRWSAIAETAGRFRRFPQVLAPARVLNAAGSTLVPIVLAATYGARVAGFYALAYRALIAPMSLVGEAFQHEFIGDVAGLTADRDRRDLVQRTLRKLASWIVVPAIVVAVVAPWVVQPVFGEGWETTGTYVRLLTPMMALQFMAVPVSPIVMIRERQGLQLGWDAARIVAVVAVITTAHVLGLPDTQMMAWLGVVGAACYAASIGLSWWVVRPSSRPAPTHP